jgi:hypothetical protein
MPWLTLPLVNGYAVVDVLVTAAPARRRALRLAGHSVSPPVAYKALIDTGAGASCIDPTVRQALNLVPFTVSSVSVPGNPQPVRANQYRLSLTVRHPAGNAQLDLSAPLLKVVETALAQTGYSIVIGCDVLALCDFHYAGRKGTFSLIY